MIINKIILKNLGPFVGENTIVCDSTNEKSIVLIGGKNGAGKTTFFNAIRFCLYGCKVLGYEVNNANYYSKISQLLNDKAMLTNDSDFYCKIELSFNDGEHYGTYTVVRKRLIKNSNISEQREYYEGKRLLDEGESFDFENLLLHLIPPDLFNFYFFDGEKISSMLSGDGTSNAFRDAFIKISGLDNLDYLVKCFKKYSDKAMKDKKIFKHYQLMKKAFKESKKDYDLLTKEIDDISFEINSIEEAIKLNYKNYIKSGGLAQKDLNLLNQSLINEEVKRDSLRKELKEYANSGLPFVIIKTLLKDFLNSITTAKENNNIDITQNFLSSAQGKKILKKYLLKDIDIEPLLNDIEKLKVSSDEKVFYKLSETEYFKVVSEIKNKLSIDEKYYCSIEEEIKKSLENSKKIRTLLSKVSTDKYHEYNDREVKLQKQLISLEKKKESLQKKYLQISVDYKINENNYMTALKNYENDLKNVSIHDISSKAYLEFSKLETKLYQKNLKVVNEYFMSTFNSLINKKGLIDGIYINKDLSVYPYRIVKSNFDEIEQLIKDNGKDSFINIYGEKAYEVFMESKGNIVNLPMKIRGTLSEGENQIYLMSLYLALTKLKTVPMPFIIDTPFGRIDNEHRQNILSNFFLKLCGQLIILSTDEEITKPYIKVMRKKISNYYLFKNNGNGKTNILKGKYFCEVK